jgi:hypothetical protein
VVLFHCVGQLATAPRQRSTGQFPLLGFVRVLGERADPAQAAPLRQWLEEAIAHLGRDDEDRTALRRSLITAQGADAPRSPEDEAEPASLIVQVEQEAFAQEQYRLKAWLPVETGRLCEEVALHRIPPERLWVEMLLPRSLLCMDVDQWPLEDEFVGPTPLGVEHRVVLRSLDRLRSPKAAQALRGRWEALEKRRRDLCRVGTSLKGPELGDAPAVLVDVPGGPVLLTLLRDAPSVVCALVGRPPEPGGSKGDLLSTLLAAGIPVVMWTRDRPCDPEILVRDVCLGDLPDRVWTLRKDALVSRAEQHPGKAVSILWDDPTHTSPDFDPGNQLRAPQPLK